MNREDFLMLNNNIIYFDNGATTFKPKCVLNSIEDYYKKYTSNAHRGDYNISYKVDTLYEQARDDIAKFINSRSEEVIFTSGTTEALNMIANGFFSNILEENDEVLITLSEHASNVLPWFKLANSNNIKVKYINLDSDHKVTMENVKESITDKTKVISLAYITNVIGDIRPIKEICEYAHKKGIFVVVDAAQAIGHIKCDVKDLDCDFLAFSGHKMMGPTGIGALYGKKELLENLKPINLGGGMNESFDNIDEVYLKELPFRLEAGTPNIEGALGLGAAINYINEIGIDKINKYEKELRDYLVSKLKEIDFIDIVNISSESGIVSFNVKDIFAQDVAYYLNKYNICVRAGSHCAKILKKEIGFKNTVRISLYLYNTFEEIDKLVLLLSDKDKIKREMI